MEKYIKESEVFEKIKEVIYELYPVVQPRVVFDDNGYYESKELRIDFYFYLDGDIVNTQIGFLDKKSNFQYYLVKDKVLEDNVGKLVVFLINEFPYVRSVQTFPNGFEIEFVLGLEHFEQKGISCNKIIMEFSTHPKLKDNFGDLFQKYLNYIVSNFTMEMIKAPQMREMYKKYLSDMKEKIITSFTREELQQFIGLLSDEELKELLFGMNNEQFFNLCDRFSKGDSNTKGNVRELKRMPINLGNGEDK